MTGSGAVTYTVTPNFDINGRSGVVTVINLSNKSDIGRHVVNQDGVVGVRER
jgi:hypothetical protein